MAYTISEIQKTVEAQRAFFRTGTTLDVNWRLHQLRTLRDAVKAHEAEFEDALYKDLGRSRVEAYLCDIGPVIVEINEMLHGLRRWARPERHFSGLMCFPSLLTKVYKMPYGVTLVISPFNFPILLTLGVVAASISGGNTVVIKASAKSRNCTAVMKKFIAEVFPPEFVTLIDGGHDVADMCLEQRWDKIFYTGSPKIGRHVLAKAAENLTPVALELGGGNGELVHSQKRRRHQGCCAQDSILQTLQCRADLHQYQSDSGRSGNRGAISGCPEGRIHQTNRRKCSGQ